MEAQGSAIIQFQAAMLLPDIETKAVALDEDGIHIKQQHQEDHPMTQFNTSMLASMLCLALAAPVLAQERAVQRNVNQQERIQEGLQSGELSTREAAKLEKEQTRVEQMESRALRDGNLSNAEKVRLEAAQDKASRDLYREKHDAQQGNPNSASSQRMQADVQRNINQQKRIDHGLESGQLTNKEVAALEHGQAKVTRREAVAGADGHVGPHEQRAIQHAENRQSAHVWNKKHNAHNRP